MVASLLS